MKTGHTPSRSVPEYWEDADIPWFTLADVWQLRDGKQLYLGDTSNRISALGLANSAAELLPAGTVVLSRTASVGFSGIMPVPMATSQDFWNWVCGPDLLPNYLNYQFRAMAPEFQSLNMGSTHKTIYQRDAASLQILVPPVQEQQAITAYLDRETAQIDTLIDEQLRLIDLLRERRVGVVRSAVSGLDKGGEVREDGDWFGVVPHGWTAAAVKRHFDVMLGKMINAGKKVDGGIDAPYLAAGSIQPERLLLDESKRMTFTLDELSHYTLRRGDVVVVEGGAGYGRSHCLRRDLHGWGFQNHVARLRPRSGLVDPFFATYCLKSCLASGFIEANNRTATMPSLSREVLGSIRIPVPPLEEQRDIVAYLDEQISTIDALIAETERFIDLANERRSALITTAVTGQIDIRGEAA